jgi:hypothetical protein
LHSDRRLDQPIDRCCLRGRFPDIRIRRIVKRLGAAAISGGAVRAPINESLDDSVLEARRRHVQGRIACVHVMRDGFEEVIVRPVACCPDSSLFAHERRRRIHEVCYRAIIARDDRVHEIEKTLVGRCGSRALRHHNTP